MGHGNTSSFTIVVFAVAAAAAAAAAVVSAIIPFGLLFAFDDPLLVSFHDKDLYSVMHAFVFSSADRVRHINTMYVLPSTDILRLIMLGAETLYVLPSTDILRLIVLATETLCLFFHLLIITETL